MAKRSRVTSLVAIGDLVNEVHEVVCLRDLVESLYL